MLAQDSLKTLKYIKNRARNPVSIHPLYLCCDCAVTGTVTVNMAGTVL